MRSAAPQRILRRALSTAQAQAQPQVQSHAQPYSNSHPNTNTNGHARNILFTDHRSRSDDHDAFRRPGRPAPPSMLLPSDLRQAVRQEYIRTSRARSPHLETLPRFSSILKGFRPGELTIFTGPTGSGKTTVLSQISLDLAAQQVPVLWGSFEVRNARLVQAMLQQIATEPILLDADTDGAEAGSAALSNNAPPSSAEELFDTAYDRLAELPVHLMDVFGSTPLEHVLAAMESGVQLHSSRLIILDNLQFMLSGQGSSNFDKFDLVDQSVAAVRHFCNRHAVHVVLVVHPRKELDETPLGLCSVSGTAKATQEADNVIVLQKLEGNRRFLEVKKNRFDGELGRVPIGFARPSRMVYELEDAKDEEGKGKGNRHPNPNPAYENRH